MREFHGVSKRKGNKKLGFDLRDKGGRRSGTDRRQFSYSSHIPERREDPDRRNGDDRRDGWVRRGEEDRRSSRERRGGQERRAAFI